MNRSLLARSAVQGAWWAFAWRVFVFSAVLEVLLLLGRALAPEAFALEWAVVEVLTRFAVFTWLVVRIVLPTCILLRRHHQNVFDLSVAADPALAKAIVIRQWSYLRTDLTLPWRAIRG